MNLPYWEEKLESCIIIVNTGDAKSFVSMEKLWKQGYLFAAIEWLPQNVMWLYGHVQSVTRTWTRTN